MSAAATRTPDFTRTPEAVRNRTAKARELAKYAWQRGLTSTDLAALTHERRRKLAAAAGVQPPSTDETWAEARDLLNAMVEWALANPGHPHNEQHALEERGLWVAAPAPDPEPVADPLVVDELDAPPAPAGWAALSALPRLTARCSFCTQRAVVGMGDRYRCPDHPPQPGQWGWRMDWTPKPQAVCAPARCHCGRCATWRPW